MALSVQTNTAAMTALKHLNANNAAMNSSLERLSSGFRVNNAADDASGYAVSAKLSGQTERLKAASLNATQAQAMTKMADAGVNEIQNMIVRIETLATQAGSANNNGELGKLDAERIKLESAIDKIANSTNYNGVNLLNGIDASTAVLGVADTATGTYTAGNTSLAAAAVTTFVAAGGQATYTFTADAAGTITALSSTGATGTSGAFAAGGAGAITLDDGTGMTLTFGATAAAGAAGSMAAGTGGTAAVAATAYAAALSFQVGADNSADNQVQVNLGRSYTTTSLGLGAVGSDLTTQAGAQLYIDIAKGALDTLVNYRAELGATQNQVAFVQANLATSIEQTTAAVSSIRDADMAQEMADFTKNQILTQASTSMLAQANQAAQNVMTLFR